MKLIPIICALALCSCATTPEARLNKAMKIARVTPFNEHPALYADLERKGLLTPEKRQEWQRSWDVARCKIQADREQRRRWWASLTPGERLQYQMLDMQRQQMLLQSFQVSELASANFQMQQQTDAYDRRTQVMAQPINVNLTGYTYPYANYYRAH